MKFKNPYQVQLKEDLMKTHIIQLSKIKGKEKILKEATEICHV